MLSVAQIRKKTNFSKKIFKNIVKKVLTYEILPV